MQDLDEEELKYIPICIATTLESFFRQSFKELIDFGAPFSDHSLIILRENKDYISQNINHFNARSLSLGDVTSNLIKISSLENILKNTSILIFGDQQKSEDIKKELLMIYTESETPETLPFEKESIFQYIKQTYDWRNIFCHEAALRFEVKYEDIENCYLSSKVFIRLMRKFLFNKKFPDSSDLGCLTQFELNAEQQENYSKNVISMNGMVEKIKIHQNQKDRSAFDELLKNWKEFAETNARFLARHEDGGSLGSTLYYHHLARFTELYTKELEEHTNIYSSNLLNDMHDND